MRYLIVGAVCAAIHNLVMIGGAALGLHYLVSAVGSYALVVCAGYALHAGFTFSQSPSPSSFVRYAVAMAANYPLTVALLFVLCDFAKAPMVIASPAVTVILVAWNYVASRWAIAHRREAGAEGGGR